MAKLPIAAFLTTRLTEYDATFDLRGGTGFESLFFKPMEFIVQPFRDEADNMQVAQSFRRILLTNDPDSFNEEAVDALANNLFVFRDQGDTSAGVARVYYVSTVDREWPAGGAVFTGSNGNLYSNPSPFSISASQMGSQIEGGLFYYDLPVRSVAAGANDLAADGLVSVGADPDAVSVTNKLAIAGGRVKETNTQLITRTKNSIAVRDLVTGKGFNAILFENFSAFLLELQAIGLGDDEMMRDILFNTHVGGRVDGYFKTTAIKTGTKDFVGLLVDTTRQAFSARNVVLPGTGLTSLGNPTVDRTGGRAPILQQVKLSVAATYTSTVDLSSPIDLSTRQYVKIGIDGMLRDVRVAGVSPAATNRNEIVALINVAFGVNVIFQVGNSIRITSPTTGTASQIVIDDPTVGLSVALLVFGLTTGSAHVYQGDGPITFVEGQDYAVADPSGSVQRLIGPSIVAPQTTGSKTALSASFQDTTPAVFSFVTPNDILTIESGPDAGDYRILSLPDATHLLLDAELTTSAAGVSYHINRTGIKDGETVFVQYYFNPLSIDIGPRVKLDPVGKTRGIRPGREEQTITDVAYLRTVSVELIDPLTHEPIGTVLSGLGGYGVGGYGVGPYGIGSGQDYYLRVNSPTERFSAFEDSFLVISSAFQGFSFRVTYEYAPEVLELHDFVRSETERVLDGDLLMKHMLPAYVSGEIQYSIDATDSAIPSNDVMQGLVATFINLRKSGAKLVFSEIEQFITRVTDPFDRFGTKVNAFALTARLHNTDGTTVALAGKDFLEVPTPLPPPKNTPRPLSPRITHWVADQVVLTRIE